MKNKEIVEYDLNNYFQWHSLSREEQAKYYEKARIERQRHMQLYPHWNARDNYRYGAKKKKRKRDKSDDPGFCAVKFKIATNIGTKVSTKCGLIFNFSAVFTLINFCIFLVAQFEQSGASKILRTGET